MNNQNPGVWITGASSGIGKAAVEEFISVGCNVFASSRRVTELERMLQDDKKGQIEIYPCNVASYKNVDQTVKKITSEYNINCLVNNAGVTSFKLAKENTIKEIDEIINTNLLGSIYAIKAVLPHMIKLGGGTIINVLSFAAKKTFLKSSAYSASKMGLLGYSNVLREEVRKYNIRIINIIPGATETAMWDRETREKHSERMMSTENIARLMVSAFLQKENLVSEEIVIRPITGDLD